MLFTLLAWIFITLVCWAWGVLVLHNIKIILKDSSFLFPHFSIICLAGLAAVTVFTGILSLFMPVGNWETQLIIICPCFLLFFQKTNLSFGAQLKSQFTGLHPTLLFLLIACLATILIMCTWTINHPDTLGYHAQTIQWIEKYKAVPGLVHLHVRYGYQGLWYVACALFSFPFFNTNALTFINSAIILWYLFFIIQQVNKCLLAPGKKLHGLLWLLLFVSGLLSYTQVRLTASSASPDFIATLFLWTVFYLVLKKEAGHSVVHWLLIIVLSIFSITLKLSAIPVFIIAGYAAIQLIRLKKIKTLLVSGMLGALILFPFLARNIITSGYVVFPSTFPDIVNVDWKFDKGSTQLEKDYITAYARTHVNYVKEDIETVMAMDPKEWMPVWWKNNSPVDKTILFFLALSLIAAVVRLNVIIRSHPYTKASLLTALTGVIFWFVQAPDPRFGFGFIVPFIAIILTYLLASFKVINNISKKAITIPILLMAVAVSGYMGYRSLHFFSPEQMIKPMGIEKKSSASFHCGDILFYKPGQNEFCGDLPIPCVYSDSCNNFELRGDKITDGFRAKK